QVASFAYQNGTMNSSLAPLTSNDPQAVLAQSAILIHLSTSRQQQLEQFLAAANALAGAKQTVQRTEKAVAKLKHQLAGQKASLPSVPTSALQPGDILEFAGDSHVGIYVGGGMLIDAPQPGMTVEKVSLSSSWYSANLVGAVRP